MKKYSIEVQEIHRAFHTAADKLIDKAKEILKDQSRRDVLKAKRLIQLGFINAQQSNITENLSKLDEGEIGIIEAEKLNYYQIRYPNNKYITFSQVKEICEKYNLIFADICRYKGFVPESNLDEIEKFKIEPDDIGTETASCEVHHTYGTFLTLDGGALCLDLQKRDAPAKNYTKPINVKSGLKICAPEIDIETKGFSTNINGERYELPNLKPSQMVEEINTIPIYPDPVILQPVRYGFLIVTAWGDEASDEIVLNPKIN
jgi:hypothetical protein